MKILVSLSEQQKFWAKNLLLRDAKLLAQTEKGLVGTGLDHNDPNDTKTEGDIPGQALNPEDFYQADMVKEIAMLMVCLEHAAITRIVGSAQNSGS